MIKVSIPVRGMEEKLDQAKASYALNNGGGGVPVICPYLSIYLWTICRTVQTVASPNCKNIFYFLN